MNCTQPGCTGQIEDGYCNLCGMAAAPSAPAPAAGSSASGNVPAGVAAAPSTRTNSSRLGSAPLGSARSKGTRSTRRTGTGSTRLRGRQLGAGLTVVPTRPQLDPRSAVMANPSVAEDKRTCSKCGSPVGRSRAGKPGKADGFCPNCRTPFSFTPKLQPGDVVGGQYEVVGCLAHGGLGWIYLARDKNVSDRWVVLKGLLNSGDVDAMAAAIAERQFLAEVEHPAIVEIYNFAMHDGAGYIVMEYVGGVSLKQILKERMRANGGRYDPVPVDQAIAYLVEILPAFQFLHDTGLVYCDFKPDNMIQTGDNVKLIDLGGVRRVDDPEGAIYGTVGFQAPEVAEVGPSVASDIYTIGRTLLVLTMEFRGYQSTYVKSLPAVADTPLFSQYDSLYRLVLKCCAPDPADRFQSADELRIQLLGVLREVVTARPDAGPATHSTQSPLFTAPVVADDRLNWTVLPTLQVDDGDAAAAWLAGVSIDDPEQRLVALAAAPEQSVEVRLATARAAIEAGRFDESDAATTAILDEDPWEWRSVWLSGLSALAEADRASAAGADHREPMARAATAFNTVYGQVPGELAPKLALAYACERTGEPDIAEALYLTCLRVDANYAAPAAFGLARIRGARGDLDGALAALSMVPSTSRSFVTGRRQRAALLANSGRGLPALAEAIDAVDALSIDARDRAELTVDVFSRAVALVTSGAPQAGAGQVRIAGVPSDEKSLRSGLEAAYLDLAGLTEDHEKRIALVDAANQVRPWSLT
jgi:serine/threonine-protein kinase PknG